MTIVTPGLNDLYKKPIDYNKNLDKTSKTTQQHSKAVRPSLRTHQKFEVATCHKSRIHEQISETKYVNTTNPKGITISAIKRGKDTTDYSSNEVRYAVKMNWTNKLTKPLIPVSYTHLTLPTTPYV